MVSSTNAVGNTITNNKEVLAWDIYNTFKPIVNIYTAI